VWWISKKCLDKKQTDTVNGVSVEHRYSVGPGYIYRVSRDEKSLAPQPPGEEAPTVKTYYVNDYRARTEVANPGYLNGVNGGLGAFGWHHARGTPGQTQAGDDPRSPGRELNVGRTPPVIEERMCAGSHEQAGVDNTGAYARSALPPEKSTHCPFFDDGEVQCVHYTFDVYLRDTYGETGFGVNTIGGPQSQKDAIARIRYRYTFYRSAVAVWIAVTTYAKVNSAGTPFIKEPKFATVLQVVEGSGNLAQFGYKRIAVFGRQRLTNTDGTKHDKFEKAVMEGEPEAAGLSTDFSPYDDRVRVRWDFGTDIDPAPNDQDPSEVPCDPSGACPQPPCPSSEHFCFNVLMQSWATSGQDISRFSDSAGNWERSGQGLDRWAVCSGKSDGAEGCGSPTGGQDGCEASDSVQPSAAPQARARAYCRDTRGENENCDVLPCTGTVSSCGAGGLADQNGNGTNNDEEDLSIMSEAASPDMDSRRHWEHGGFKDPPGENDTARENPNRYTRAFTFFHGWADEAGPLDCEPMQREFGPPGETWGTFAVYSLGDGWRPFS
jgi:hypothetical protein